jgi:hypothetical protein
LSTVRKDVPYPDMDLRLGKDGRFSLNSAISGSWKFERGEVELQPNSKLVPLEWIEFGSVQPGGKTPAFSLDYDKAKDRIVWAPKGAGRFEPAYVFVRVGE